MSSHMPKNSLPSLWAKPEEKDDKYDNTPAGLLIGEGQQSIQDLANAVQAGAAETMVDTSVQSISLDGSAFVSRQGDEAMLFSHAEDAPVFDLSSGDMFHAVQDEDFLLGSLGDDRLYSGEGSSLFATGAENIWGSGDTVEFSSNTTIYALEKSAAEDETVQDAVNQIVAITSS